MRVVIPDDYQDCVRHLNCFGSLRGHEVRIFHDTVSDTDALAERFEGAEAIVLTRERTAITAALLERLPDLRLICQTGKLAGHVDVAACQARGIKITEGSGSGAATAELAWALMLASRRNLVSEVNRLKDGQWQGSLGQQLQGQVLGIWGYGRIGRQVASYGRAFGMKVLVWGREASLEAGSKDGHQLAGSVGQLLDQSDVLSLHVRLLAATRGLMRAEHLARMKPSALLVNTSRAELIEAGALVKALQQGRPGFAAVDVYEAEPVLDASHPLLSLPNALCTPHLGYVERDNYEAYFGQAFEQIRLFASAQT